MKVRSSLTGGYRTDGNGDPLIRQGEWDFEGRRLSSQERAFVYALRDSNLLEIIEEDDCEVVPIAPAIEQRKEARAAAVAAFAPSSKKRATKKRVSRA